jgi:hypothetical protein
MGGKKKRGAGRGGTHFKGADGGEGKEGAWSGAPHGGQWKGELVQQRRREIGTGPGTAGARGAAMPCG